MQRIEHAARRGDPTTKRAQILDPSWRRRMVGRTAYRRAPTRSVSTIVSLFPIRYFETNGLKPDWPNFLDDFSDIGQPTGTSTSISSATALSAMARSESPPLIASMTRSGFGRSEGCRRTSPSFSLRQRRVEPPVDEVADLYSPIWLRTWSAICKGSKTTFARRSSSGWLSLMVAMCYQLGDRVVDELINELEAMQHA